MSIFFLAVVAVAAAAIESGIWGVCLRSRFVESSLFARRQNKSRQEPVYGNLVDQHNLSTWGWWPEIEKIRRRNLVCHVSLPMNLQSLQTVSNSSTDLWKQKHSSQEIRRDKSERFVENSNKSLRRGKFLKQPC